MDITKATVLYFTGTNTTKQYAETIASALPYEAQLFEIRHDNPLNLSLAEQDLLVLAAPVYGGYITPFVWEQLEHVSGKKTPAVLLAVYGARDYDNALLEMDSKLSAKGFTTVAAAALVARHSIATTIAPDRPNAVDLHGLRSFANALHERILFLPSVDDAPALHFKGNLDGHAAKNPAPITSDDCTQCSTCAKQCPTGAIPENAPHATNEETCISCMRCIMVCPHHARSLPEPIVANATARLEKIADPAKSNEYF